MVPQGRGGSDVVSLPLLFSLSAYRIGDQVTYRYSGSYSAVPVTLEERVLAKEGLQLTIEVQATRGAEQLTWVQVVTDTAENQRAGVVDALYEVVDGERRLLANACANADNADLMRLPLPDLPRVSVDEQTGADHGRRGWSSVAAGGGRLRGAVARLEGPQGELVIWRGDPLCRVGFPTPGVGPGRDPARVCPASRCRLKY